MATYTSRPERFVIPRWRDFKETSKAGELAKDKSKNTVVFSQSSIQNQVENWKKEKTVINAIELFNSAYIINDHSIAIEAAEFITNNCKDKNHPLHILSKVVLNHNQQDQTSECIGAASFANLDNKIRLKIQVLRVRLQQYPQNGVLWIDLARWYTVIGKIYEAKRAIKVALQLCPNNIFVLRSTVRFLLHIARYDKNGEDSLSFALRVIRKHPLTKIDPWLMATEISLSSYMQKNSLLIKSGFALIESKKFSPFSLSELSSALATEELKYNNSKSRKLFTSSLINPNENTIAQAQWATEIIGTLPLEETQQNSFEANSYTNYHLGMWAESFDEALNWLVDQPFSVEPANHASYIASAIIDDNELCVKICDFGLRSNSNEFALLNNKAYSLAINKKSKEAEETFNQINFNSLKESEKVVYLATKGSIQYSKNDTEGGDIYYKEAEVLARKSRDKSNEFRVKLYRIKTEYIFGASAIDIESDFINLMSELKNFKSPDMEKLFKNIQDRMKVKLPKQQSDTVLYTSFI